MLEQNSLMLKGILYFVRKVVGFRCNHMECVSQDNLGYVQGILKSCVPFEAELRKNEVSVNISVVIPELLYVSDKKSNTLRIDNLSGFHNQVECIHNGVLTIGMVEGGIGTEFAKTSLKFMSFPNQVIKRTISIVK